MPSEIECVRACRMRFLFFVVLSCLLRSCRMLALIDALTSSSQDTSQKPHRIVIVHPRSRIVGQNC